MKAVGNYLNMDDSALTQRVGLGMSLFSVGPSAASNLSPVAQVMDSLEVMVQANHVEIISSQISLQGPVWHRICRMTAD